MSRLTIDVTDQQHKLLKSLAALQGKSIREYAVERLFPSGSDDDMAWRELKTLLSQRITAGVAGDVSARSIDTILDEEMGGDQGT